MWFDAQAALAKIERKPPPPATPATSATNPPAVGARVAVVADVAGPASACENLSGGEDAAALLELLAREGPQTYGAAAVALGIGATQAWRAEAELLRAGLIRLGPLGRAMIIEGGKA